MKKKGLFIFNIIFISIAFIALVSSIYASKPTNIHEVQYFGIELSDNQLTMTVSGSNNASYKLDKIEQTVIDNTLFITFYESMFSGDPYPYEVNLTGDYRNITSIKIKDNVNTKEIYP